MAIVNLNNFINCKDTYSISDDGFIFNRNKRLKGYKDKYGYMKIKLLIDNKRKDFFVHRLVGLCFLKNQLNKCDINHKNGIHNDNSVENLEWATRSENLLHSYRVLKRNKTIHKAIEFRKRKIICVETNKQFNSITEASTLLNIHHNSISNILSGIARKTRNNLTFRYMV